jgi:hypothetical protein
VTVHSIDPPHLGVSLFGASLPPSLFDGHVALLAMTGLAIIF